MQYTYVVSLLRKSADDRSLIKRLHIRYVCTKSNPRTIQILDLAKSLSLLGNNSLTFHGKVLMNLRPDIILDISLILAIGYLIYQHLGRWVCL